MRCVIIGMLEKNTKSYFIFGVFAVLVLIVFYIVFDQINTLDTHVKNVELNLELALKSDIATSTVSSTAPSLPASGTNNPPITEQGENIIIPTGIVFNATSSPLLQPQATIVLIVQDVAKQADGKVFVHLKASTERAQSYSAIDPKDFFQLVSLSSENQRALAADGAWSSMPPQGTVQGTLMFQVDPSQTSLILQVGKGDAIKFYQFDFQTKTYKEVILG